MSEHERAIDLRETAAPDLTTAAYDVLAERRRHVVVEGWDAAHDDGHRHGELAAAAACYALASREPDWLRKQYAEPHSRGGTKWWTTIYVQNFWPGWARRWFKPVDRRRDLVKAGALILAEIERLDRAALRDTGT